ncbi:MAG: hypothetical protein QXP01_07700, partial [Candidatus Hadarchaeum sp.]
VPFPNEGEGPQQGGVVLGLLQPPHGKPDELLPQPQLLALCLPDLRAGREAMGVHPVGQVHQLVRPGRPAPEKALVSLLGHLRGHVGQEVREAVGQVGAALGSKGAAHLEGIMGGGDQDRNRGQRPGNPGQEVGVDHVAVDHVGPPPPEKRGQTQDRLRARLAAAHAQGNHGNACAL